jgi:hypothetical protein
VRFLRACLLPTCGTCWRPSGCFVFRRFGIGLDAVLGPGSFVEDNCSFNGGMEHGTPADKMTRLFYCGYATRGRIVAEHTLLERYHHAHLLYPSTPPARLPPLLPPYATACIYRSAPRLHFAVHCDLITPAQYRLPRDIGFVHYACVRRYTTIADLTLAWNRAMLRLWFAPVRRISRTRLLLYSALR